MEDHKKPIIFTVSKNWKNNISNKNSKNKMFWKVLFNNLTSRIVLSKLDSQSNHFNHLKNLKKVKWINQKLVCWWKSMMVGKVSFSQAMRNLVHTSRVTFGPGRGKSQTFLTLMNPVTLMRIMSRKSLFAYQ